MSDNIAAITATQGAKSTNGDLPASAQEKGALSIFGETGSPDLDVAFAGDGEHTPSQVMSRFIEVSAAQLPDMQLLQLATANPKALDFSGNVAAEESLQQNNPGFGGPNDSIEVGKIFQSDLRTAIKALARPENLSRLGQLTQGSSLANTEYKPGGALTQAPTPPAIGFPSDPRV